MNDLVSWLRSQLDADEAIARAAIQGPWQTRAVPELAYADHLSPYVVYGRSPLGGDRIVQVCMFEAAWQRHENAAFMVANDPAHVLRTVAAHRAILSVVEGFEHTECDDRFYSCALADLEPLAGARCSCGLAERRLEILRPLSSIYAERDGFDPSWKVET